MASSGSPHPLLIQCPIVGVPDEGITMDDLRVNLARTRKRFVALKVCAIPVLFLAILLLTLALDDGKYNSNRMSQSIFSAAFFLLGGFMLPLPRRKPTSEILRLAQPRNGL